MLEEKTCITKYGTTVVILLPSEIYKDSLFPFPKVLKLSEGEKGTEYDIIKTDVKIRIDENKKRLIIEEV